MPAWPDPLDPGLDDVRTDLAVEAVRARSPAPGVAVREERHGAVQVNRVAITNEDAERAMRKRRGQYVTLEAPGLKRRDTAVQEQVARLLAAELRRMLPPENAGLVLVVGLGNWKATPDALGPRVVERLLITRHLQEQVPANLRGGLRAVAAVAPGVLGLTGIETGEIVRGIVDRVRPAAILAVDALASRSIERIVTTIQIADAGIHPGSGVGNDRGDLSRETLGVPVVALGVPTVVHAVTIAQDCLDLLAEHLATEPAYRGLSSLPADAKRSMVAQVLSPTVGDLMVTPKEIDILMDDMARVIAAGVNAALHAEVASQPTLL